MATSTAAVAGGDSSPEDDLALRIPPVLTVAAVARRLGVAPATLRTWDRRYGLGPSEHTAGAHRRYTAADVERLSLMRRLTLEGLPPAEAASLALAGETGETGETGDAGDAGDAGDPSGNAPGASGRTPDAATRGRTGGAGGRTGGAGERVSDAASGGAGPGATQAEDGLGASAAEDGLGASGAQGADSAAVELRRPRRAGGGHVIAMPQAEPAARGLARAAMSLDTDACMEILEVSLRDRGVIATWNELLVPVLMAAGERWAVTGQGIDVEHVLSETVMGVMRAMRPVGGVQSARPALLAGAEGEQHILPLHVLAAALAEQRVAVRLLGARVPREALAAAVRRSGPAAVFLWSQMPATGDCEQLAEFPSLRPAPRVVVGGPGWDRNCLPAAVHVAGGLEDAVEQMLAAVGR